MAFVLNDRIKDTTVTTGTGAYELDETPPSGFITFATGGAINLDTTYYAITDGTDWETGIGTYSTSTPPQLYRTQIISSTNGNAEVNWGAGSKTITCTTPGKVATGWNLIGTYNFLGASTLTIDNIFSNNLGYRTYKMVGRGITTTFETTTSGLNMRLIRASTGTVETTSSYSFVTNQTRSTNTTTGVTISYAAYNCTRGSTGGQTYIPITGYLTTVYQPILLNNAYNSQNFELTFYNPQTNNYANSPAATSPLARAPYPQLLIHGTSSYDWYYATNYCNPVRQTLMGLNTGAYSATWRGVYFYDASGRALEGAIDVYGLSGGQISG